MSDIVERLRFLQRQYEQKMLPATAKSYGEAADEIERLREQVKYWNGIACEDRAEVERLRAIIRDGSGGYTARELEAEKLKSHEI